jgi:signal peptidase I
LDIKGNDQYPRNEIGSGGESAQSVQEIVEASQSLLQAVQRSSSQTTNASLRAAHQLAMQRAISALEVALLSQAGTREAALAELKKAEDSLAVAADEFDRMEAALAKLAAEDELLHQEAEKAKNYAIANTEGIEEDKLKIRAADIAMGAMNVVRRRAQASQEEARLRLERASDKAQKASGSLEEMQNNLLALRGDLRYILGDYLPPEEKSLPQGREKATLLHAMTAVDNKFAKTEMDPLQRLNFSAFQRALYGLKIAIDSQENAQEVIQDAVQMAEEGVVRTFNEWNAAESSFTDFIAQKDDSQKNIEAAIARMEECRQQAIEAEAKAGAARIALTEARAVREKTLLVFQEAQTKRDRAAAAAQNAIDGYEELKSNFLALRDEAAGDTEKEPLPVLPFASPRISPPAGPSDQEALTATVSKEDIPRPFVESARVVNFPEGSIVFPDGEAAVIHPEAVSESPSVGHVWQEELEEEAPVQSKWRVVWSYVKVVIFALALAVLLRNYVYEMAKVEGESMYPTLQSDDRLFTSKITYKLSKPQRGDIIVLQAPDQRSKYYIKRVIALPGEHIRIAGGQVFINNMLIEEDYAVGMTNGREVDLFVEEDAYFVMGDNRSLSHDSRDSSVGTIKLSEIQGKAVYRLFPWRSIGAINKY